MTIAPSARGARPRTNRPPVSSWSVWPPSFALAKAYTDQLERKGCAASAVATLRSQIGAAEKANGAARNSALTAAVGELPDGRQLRIDTQIVHDDER